MIGYYVHHQGRGHLGRARALARHLDEPVTGLSSLSRPHDWRGPWRDLPEDDGSRDDPLLSDRSWAITSFQLDVDALAASATRIVIAVGEESLDTITGRTTLTIAQLMGQEAIVIPSHHGGFMGGESGYPGKPEAFARKLRDVLDNDR